MTPEPLVSRKVEHCATVSQATCVQQGTPNAGDKASSQLFHHPTRAKTTESSKAPDSQMQVQLPIAESSLSSLSVQTCAETASNPVLHTSGADVTIPDTAYTPSVPSSLLTSFGDDYLSHLKEFNKVSVWKRSLSSARTE